MNVVYSKLNYEVFTYKTKMVNKAGLLHEGIIYFFYLHCNKTVHLPFGYVTAFIKQNNIIT
jgi:hypothetical protein